MAQLSYEDYEKFVKKAENSGNYQRANIRYFSLKDDGDTAIVRFNIHSLADIQVSSVHTVETNVNGRTIYSTVNCLRESPRDDVEKCPLCASGNKVAFRIFVPLLSYNQDEDGNIVAESLVWTQGTKIRQTLKSFIDDYGDLSDMLFKVTRHGKKGDRATTYSILPANPNIYKSTIYVKDFSEFENHPNYLDYFVQTRTPEDINTYLETGNFPNPFAKKQQNKPVEEVKATLVYSDQTSETLVAGDKPIRGMYSPETPTNNSNQTKPIRRYSY